VAAGLTQLEAAARLGSSINAIRLMESVPGWKRVRVGDLERAAHLYAAPLSALIQEGLEGCPILSNRSIVNTIDNGDDAKLE
jgi:hypothetical protein